MTEVLSYPDALIALMNTQSELVRSPDVALALVAREQHGVLSREQALSAGLSSSAIYRRTRSGEWRALYPRVYGLRSAISSRRRELMAACLWAGPQAVVSHRAAAALWNLDGCNESPIEISVERNLLSRHGIVVHRAELTQLDRSILDGIPVTSPTRTLGDLSRFLSRDSLEIALEDALRRGLTSMPRLRWALKQPESRARVGLRSLRELLDERSVGKPQMESGFEVRLERVLRTPGLPEPQRQFEVRDGKRILGRVDFAYPQVRLAIEADSYRYHSGKRAWRNDAVRNNRLMRAGWRILHVHWDDLRRPADLIAQIRELSSLSRAERD